MTKKVHKQNAYFSPHSQPMSAPEIEEKSLKDNQVKGTNWKAYYMDYILKRPIGVLILIGFILEVQPIVEFQPSYFIATRIVNREVIVLKGTEDEEAHKQAVSAKKLAEIENAKECQKQREIRANDVYTQCKEAGKTSGYCRFQYETAKQLQCPQMPNL